MPVITKPNQHFDVLTWTGTSTASGRTFTGLNFQPDFVWAKSRSGVSGYNHQLYDAVRGTGKRISSNLTDAETTNPINGYISAFNSDGFTTVAGTTDNSWFNELNTTYVGWQWKAGGTAVTNTNGSITSQVSVNTTAGFSIVTYTGNGSNATIGHGLGVAPSMIIRKARNASLQSNWYTYHQSLSANGTVFLNLTDAYFASANYWNNTAPTSTVFSVSSATNVLNDTWVAYCFAQVAGYSAFGSYTGNGSSDGPFVYTGFRPRYYIIKNITNAQSWSVQDTARNPYNVGSAVLLPNSSSAELTGTDFVDILSNGFKIRHTGASGNNNNSGDTYIYAAFAEAPFKFSNAR